MDEKEKLAELDKIADLVKELIAAVDACEDDPTLQYDVGIVYARIHGWYNIYQKRVQNVG